MCHFIVATFDYRSCFQVQNVRGVLFWRREWAGLHRVIIYQNQIKKHQVAPTMIQAK